MKLWIIAVLVFATALASQSNSTQKLKDCQKNDQRNVTAGEECVPSANSTKEVAFNVKDKLNPMRESAGANSNEKTTCAEVFDGTEGGYTIFFPERGPVKVFCMPDRNEKTPPWMLIVKRDNTIRRLDFDLKYRHYINGFGNGTGEHWLGLDLLHYLTKRRRQELWIHVEDGVKELNIVYNDFGIGDDKDEYILHTLGRQTEYGGGVEFEFETFRRHMGYRFSTKDKDFTSSNCATLFHGGWWFFESSNQCATVALTTKFDGLKLPLHTLDAFEVNGTRVTQAFMAIRDYVD